ncbi:MAG: acetyl-CoA carboxylase biotin carboxyl carrier protein, partial [Bacteroidota bacterium]
MNNEEIKELIKLVSKLGLGKVEIEKDGFKINIKGPNMGVPMTYSPVSAPIPAPVVAQPLASVQNEPQAEQAAKVVAENSNTITVKSTMIGTFYRSTGPDKAPFVEVGSEIKKGDKICIIEAMKLFNEIESEVSGKIVKVLVD